jgi:hypothetical protein
MRRATHRGRNWVSPRLEQLEGRELLSVTVLPGHINLKSVSHGHSVFTVRIRQDAAPATGNLLSAPQASLTVQVQDSSGNDTSLGTPLSVHTTDHGVLLKFARSALSGLASGTYQLQVSDGTAADAETATFALFNPGQGHGHHGEGHGQGNGHDHHPGGQGHGHQPPSSTGNDGTSPTSPPAAGNGTTTASGHDGNSQGDGHSHA